MLDDSLEAVHAREVVRLGGQHRHVSLLLQEAAVVADQGPDQVRRRHPALPTRVIKYVLNNLRIRPDWIVIERSCEGQSRSRRTTRRNSRVCWVPLST